jgi:hypothetical protein
VSKDRALRRAKREDLRLEEARRRAHRRRRAERRDALVATVRRPMTRVRGRGRQNGLIARRRRVENGAVVTLAFLVQVLAWLLTDSWWARIAVLLGTVLFVPVIVTLVFDRRA